MARIAGVDLPKKKRVEYALTYIYGIGLKSSRDILKAVNISFDKRVNDLSEDEISVISKKSRCVFSEIDKACTVKLKRSTMWYSFLITKSVLSSDYFFSATKPAAAATIAPVTARPMTSFAPVLGFSLSPVAPLEP